MQEVAYGIHFAVSLDVYIAVSRYRAYGPSDMFFDFFVLALWLFYDGI